MRLVTPFFDATASFTLRPLVVCAAAVFLYLPAGAESQNAAQPNSDSSAVVLDRVVAVVNNQAVLQSDLDEEIKLAILDPGEAGLSVLTPQRALEQLIGRSLIQQQIRQEDAREADPSQDQVDARLHEIRTELPICVRQNCATEEGWNQFLSSHGLTAQRVETYLRYRLQILGFIEMRFRQGIRITPQEIETYYRETLLPQYAAGEKKPSLESVAPRIQEILLQRQVNTLFDDWLKNLRMQGDIEVLDPSFETPEAKNPAKDKTKDQGGPAAK
jgi:hypothetical protein